MPQTASNGLKLPPDGLKLPPDGLKLPQIAPALRTGCGLLTQAQPQPRRGPPARSRPLPVSSTLGRLMPPLRRRSSPRRHVYAGGSSEAHAHAMASPAARSSGQARRGQLSAGGGEGPLGSAAVRCEGARPGPWGPSAASARPGAGFYPQAARRMGAARAKDVWELLGEAGGTGGGGPRGRSGGRRSRLPGRAVFVRPVVTPWSPRWRLRFSCGCVFLFFLCAGCLFP